MSCCTVPMEYGDTESLASARPCSESGWNSRPQRDQFIAVDMAVGHIADGAADDQRGVGRTQLRVGGRHAPAGVTVVG